MLSKKFPWQRVNCLLRLTGLRKAFYRVSLQVVVGQYVQCSAVEWKARGSLFLQGSSCWNQADSLTESLGLINMQVGGCEVSEMGTGLKKGQLRTTEKERHKAVGRVLGDEGRNGMSWEKSEKGTGEAVGQRFRVYWRLSKKQRGGSWSLVCGEKTHFKARTLPWKIARAFFIFILRQKQSWHPRCCFSFSAKRSLPSRNTHPFYPLPAAWLLEVQIVFPSICSICSGSSDLSIHLKCLGIGWFHVIIYFDFPQGHLDYYFFNYKITFKLNKQIMLSILQHKHNLSDSCCRGSSSLESALQNELAKHSPSPSNHPSALTSQQGSSPMSAFFNSYPQV